MENNVMAIRLDVRIIAQGDYQDLHITDNYGNSCNYGDSNYDRGMTSKSVGDCVKEFLKSYHGLK